MDKLNSIDFFVKTIKTNTRFIIYGKRRSPTHHYLHSRYRTTTALQITETGKEKKRINIYLYIKKQQGNVRENHFKFT